MTKEEAREWLTGERSNWNDITSFYAPAGDDGGLATVRCAEADAAAAQQAYWVLRAHAEGLVPERAEVPLAVAWVEVRADNPLPDGWYWHTWAANQEVRICQVQGSSVFLSGRAPVSWSVFLEHARFAQPAFAPEPMGYTNDKI